MTSPDIPLVETDQQHHYLHGGGVGGSGGGSGSGSGSEDAVWQDHQRQPAPQRLSPNPASSPLPPGFAAGSSGRRDDDQHVKVDGEELRRTSGGNVSAPPPPGFKSDSSRDRNRQIGSERLVSNTSSTKDHDHSTASSSLRQQQQQPQQQQRQQKLNGLAGNALSAQMAQAGGGRTSSFVDLAAVLGTGLAESMDDATKGDFNQQLQQQQQQHQLRSYTSDEVQDLSFTRQSRHAAARLIGASPPRVEPLGLDVAGTFIGSSGGVGGGGGPPASLGGGIHLSRERHLDSNINNNINDSNSSGNGKSGGANVQHQQRDGFLSPAFISTSGEGRPEGLFGQNAHHNTVNHRGVGNGGDVGATVIIEPGSEMQQRSTNRSMAGSRPYDEGGDQDGGVLAALMQEQQMHCYDPQCELGIEQRSNNRPGTGALGSLMQEHQQVYCNDPQCLQQRSPERDTFVAEQRMRNLWLDDSASAGQASRHSKNQHQHQHQHFGDRSVSSASVRSDGSLTSRQIAEADIRPFIWDTSPPQQQGQYHQKQQSSNIEPSRCLAILRATQLQVPEVRTTCEAFGVLELFRSDFADRGILFASYYDIRSAQYAASELETMLRRRESNRSGNGGSEIAVYYCVPLNSSSQIDESRLILSDVPPFVDENSLVSLLSSFGSVRSLKRQGGYYGGSSYEAEFHNVQDAKQALLELSSTQPWGPDVAVEVGMRPPIDRKRGRELLGIIGRWRQGSRHNVSPSSSTGGSRPFDAPSRLNHGAPIFRGTESSASSSPAVAPTPETQLVLGPDGRYSYMVVNNQSGYPHLSQDFGAPTRWRHPQEHKIDPQRQQVVHGPNGEIFITTALPPHQPPSNYRHGGPTSSRDYWQSSSAQPPPNHSNYSNTHYQIDTRDRGPYYSHQVISNHHPDHPGAHNNHHLHSSNASAASVGGDDKDNKHLILDLEKVEQGRDSRTSLMVRNIPNKYTQQMLLSEFTENGLGPGVIDFFYLPIDFKNRCNRGYAFINFVDFKDILPFHQRYFGKHWSTFNSDKICDITYARIQGKAAMLKRFENSALMEKDEEYKPLVFISHGPEKGKRIPFPEAAATAN